MKKKADSTDKIKKPGFSAGPVAYIIFMFAALFIFSIAATGLYVLFYWLSETIATYSTFYNILGLLCDLLAETFQQTAFPFYVIIFTAGLIFMKDKTSGIIFSGAFYIIESFVSYISAMITAAVYEFISPPDTLFNILDLILELSDFTFSFFLTAVIFASVLRRKEKEALQIKKKTKTVKAILLSSAVVILPVIDCALYFLRSEVMYPVLNESTFFAEHYTLRALLYNIVSGSTTVMMILVILFVFFIFKDSSSGFTVFGCYAIVSTFIFGAKNIPINMLFDYYSLRRIVYFTNISYDTIYNIREHIDNITFILTCVASGIAAAVLFVIVYSVRNRKKKKKKGLEVTPDYETSFAEVDSVATEQNFI